MMNQIEWLREVKKHLKTKGYSQDIKGLNLYVKKYYKAIAPCYDFFTFNEAYKYFNNVYKELNKGE